MKSAMKVQFEVKQTGETFWASGSSLGSILNGLEQAEGLKLTSVEVVQIIRNEEVA